MKVCNSCQNERDDLVDGVCATCREQCDDVELTYFSEQAKSAANRRQVGGSHYQKPIQPWDFIAANKLGFFEGTALRYICRHQDKNGRQDIEKAIHYLEKLLEVEYPE